MCVSNWIYINIDMWMILIDDRYPSISTCVIHSSSVECIQTSVELIIVIDMCHTLLIDHACRTMNYNCHSKNTHHLSHVYRRTHICRIQNIIYVCVSMWICRIYCRYNYYIDQISMCLSFQNQWTN